LKFKDYIIFKSGATRNRNLSPSGSISSLFRIALTVFSSYYSTAGLQRSAHRCMVVSRSKGSDSD